MSTQCDPYYNNVQLLLHFDGTSGSKVFTDSSQNHFYLTGGSGNPDTSLETTTVLFGSASGNFGNGASYPTNSAIGPYNSSTQALLYFDTLSQLNPGTGDFTMEAFINPLGFSNTAFGVMHTNTSDHVGFGLVLVGGPIVELVWYDETGTSNNIASGIPNPTTSGWIHVAIVRYMGVLNLYVNGVPAGTGVAYAGNFNIASTVSETTVIIGWAPLGLYQYGGLMDEFRYTVGVARYTTDFTPPTSAFPDFACGPPRPPELTQQCKFVPASVFKAIMTANPGNINPRIYPPEVDTTAKTVTLRIIP